MKKSKKVVKKCCACGKKFVLGVTGTYPGRWPMCDACAGVRRDCQGWAWSPNEQTHGMLIESAETDKVLRVFFDGTVANA